MTEIIDLQDVRRLQAPAEVIALTIRPRPRTWFKTAALAEKWVEALGLKENIPSFLARNLVENSLYRAAAFMPLYVWMEEYNEDADVVGQLTLFPETDRWLCVTRSPASAVALKLRWSDYYVIIQEGPKE